MLLSHPPMANIMAPETRVTARGADGRARCEYGLNGGRALSGGLGRLLFLAKRSPVRLPQPTSGVDSKVGDMAEDFAGSKKGMGAGAQAVAAVVLVGVVGGGIWGLAKVVPDESGKSGPAVCSGAHETLPPQYVSGEQLCVALNRPDLPVLLGTPADHASTASGGGGWIRFAGGAKIASPEGNVVLKTYSVKVSASYDRLSVAHSAEFLGKTAQPRTVLGHPAVLYSDRTIALTFNGGGKAGTGPGGTARHLLVARDAKDGGGSFEVAIWRQDDVLPDDAALFRVAEKVLPTIPGWTAG